MHVRLTEKNPQLVAEQQWLVAITTTTYYITSFLLLLFGSLFKLTAEPQTNAFAKSTATT